MAEDLLADQVLEETLLLAGKKVAKRFPNFSPVQALFKQVIITTKFDLPTKRSLLEQLIQASETPPQAAEVDKAVKEAMVLSVKNLKSSSSESCSAEDLIKSLVPAVEQASTFNGLAMKWAVAFRLLRWSEPPPALPAVKAFYVEEFVSALGRLGESLLSTEAAQAALVAAIDRLEDDGGDSPAVTSKRALKQHLVAARKRLKGGPLLDDAFKRVVMAALSYAGEYEPKGHKLEETMIAVFTAASDDSKAVALALGKLVHRSRPPPAELLAKVLTSRKQLELCIGGGDDQYQDQHSASDATEIDKFACFVLPTDASKESVVADMVLRDALSMAAKKLEMSTRFLFPMDALVKSTQKLDLHYRMKWAVLERIVTSGQTLPEETVVDKALAEAVAGVIEEACTSGVWEGLDKIGTLVEAILESLEEPPMKYALVERLILACKPAKDNFSGNKVLKDGFKVAIARLQGLSTNQPSPLQALTGAIRRLPVDSSVQVILVEVLSGAYDEVKATADGKEQGEQEVAQESVEDEIYEEYLLDENTVGRLIAAKQKFKITTLTSDTLKKLTQKEPSLIKK